jgi:hypothetical protein
MYYQNNLISNSIVQNKSGPTTNIVLIKCRKTTPFYNTREVQRPILYYVKALKTNYFVSTIEDQKPILP